ncbi:MAG: YdcF family protein, partial [Endomicrobium sp.]|nr:YdcF family protein [Endomicrobium sp.]
MKRKFVSFFICVCLVSSSIPLSAPDVYAKTLSAADITSGVSITDASFKNNSSHLVFNVQDLHFNIEAQKKIFSLLERIDQFYPDFELYLEGASKKSNFEWLYGSLGKKGADAFIEALFDGGNLTGAEYFAAKHSKEINPLEEKETYNNNLILFADIIENRDAISVLADLLESRLSSLRNKYFSLAQIGLYGAYFSFHAGTLPEEKYFKYLKNEAAKNAVEINDYPNISLYLLVSGQASSVSQKKLQSQMNEFFSNLKNVLSYQQYVQLMSLANSPDDRQAFISYLYQNRESLGLAKYPQLYKFAVSLATADKLNHIDFMLEENELVRSIASGALKNADAGNVFFLSQFAIVYKKVLSGQASPYEYEYYKKELNKFKSILSSYGGAALLKDFDYYETQAQAFNDANLLRNSIFVNKMFGDVKSPASLERAFGVSANAKAALQSSSKTKIKVIIAGGFHTSGINKILNEERNISNVSFTPKIFSKTQDYPQKYVEYARAISAAETSAINTPDLYNMPASAFVKTVVNSAAQLKKSSFPQERLKEAIEAKPEIKSAQVDFTENASGQPVISVTYEDNDGNEFSVSTDDNINDAESERRITTLGEFFTPEAVKQLLNYSITDAVFNAVSSMIFARYANKSVDTIDSFKQKLIKGDYDVSTILKFANQEFLQRIAISIFTNRRINNYKEDITEIFREKFKEQLGKEVEIIVSNTQNLISEDGWCFAALETNKKGAVFYVHNELIEKLAAYENKYMQVMINAIVQHEMYEQQALYNVSPNTGRTTIHESFGKYLELQGLPADQPEGTDLNARNSHNFHQYLKSDHFEKFLLEESFQSGNSSKEIEERVKDQKKVLIFADSLLDSVVTRHSDVQYLEKLGNVSDNAEIANDLLMLRLEDETAIEKYANKIADRIGKMNIEREGITIVCRKTVPENVTSKVAKAVQAKFPISKNPVKLVYIHQDDFMNDVSLSSKTRHSMLREHFHIDEVDENGEKMPEKIYARNIVLLADTYKTGAIFAAESGTLYKYKPKNIFPLAMIDISGAVFAEEGQRSEDAGKNNLQEYFFNRFILGNKQSEINDLNFKFEAEKFVSENNSILIRNIISTKGDVSKYVYAALYHIIEIANDKDIDKNIRERYADLFDALINEVGSKDYFKSSQKNRIFNALIKRDGSDDSKDSAAIENIMANLIKIARGNVKSAPKMLITAYNVYKSAIPDNSLDPYLSFIEYIAEEKNIDRDKGKGKDEDRRIFTVSQKDYEQWRMEPFTLIAYAKLSGYEKIDINLDSIDNEKEIILRTAAQKEQISVIEEFKDEQPIRYHVSSKEKEFLQSRVEALKKYLKEARDEFNAAIMQYQRADANEKIRMEASIFKATEIYSQSVKKVMLHARYFVKEALAAREAGAIHLTDEDYSILVGGSLSKGNITSDSDVYYNIISRDKQMSQVMENNFVPMYEYLLREAGLSVFMSEGNLDSYIGSINVHKDISFLGTMNISDSRGVATFIDYEELKLSEEYLLLLEKRLDEQKQKDMSINKRTGVKDDIVKDDMSIYEYPNNGIFAKYKKECADFLSGKQGKTNIDSLLAQIEEVIYPGLQIVKEGTFARNDRKVNGKLTFSQNLFAAAYRNLGSDDAETFDHRWHFRTIDLLLKHMFLKHIQDLKLKEVDPKILDFQKNTGDFLKYLQEAKVINDSDAKNLYDAWRVLKIARQEKVSSKKSEKWTKMSEEEKRVIKILNKFISDHSEKISRIPEEKSPVSIAIGIAASSLSYDQYQIAQRRVEHYAYMYGDDPDYFAALLILDCKDEDIETYLKNVGNFVSEDIKKKISGIINFLKSIPNLPKYDELEDGSFALQNYMNIIFKAVANDPDALIAVFADRLQDMLSSKDLLVQIDGDIDRITQDINENGIYLTVAEKRSDKILISGSRAEIERLSKELESKKAEKQKVSAVSEEKIKLFYSVFVPMTSRLGFGRAFEYLRNMPFVQESPDGYINTINDIRYRMTKAYRKTEAYYKTKAMDGDDASIFFNYNRLDEELSTLDESLKAVISKEFEKSKKVKKLKDGKKPFYLHKRVKTIYSVVEKLTAPRKKDKQGASVEAFDKIEDIGDGIKRTEADLVRINEQKEKIQDLLGFHVIVTDSADRDKVIKVIEEFFSQPAGDSQPIDWEIKEEPKYESEGQKGFTRYKLTIFYAGDPILEVVIYSETQDKNERWADIPAAVVKFALAHVYYKLGAENKEFDNPYLDNIIAMIIKFEQFGIREAKPKTQLFKIDEGVSLKIIFDKEDLKENLKTITSSLYEENKRYAVIMKNGKPHITSYPVGSTVFDIVSSTVFADGKKYVLKSSGGEIILGKLPDSIDGKTKTEIAEYEMIEASDGQYYKDEPQTFRAKVLNLGYLGERDSEEPAFIKKFKEESSSEEKEIREALDSYALYFGLQDVDELYCAINAGLITEKETIDFLLLTNKYIVEIQTDSLSDGEKEGYRIQDLINKPEFESFKNKITYVKENPLEPNKFQSGVKIIFEGSQKELKDFLDKVYAESEKANKPLRRPKVKEDKKTGTLADEYFVNRAMNALKIAIKGVTALGENVWAVAGDILDKMGSSVFTVLEQYFVNSSFDGQYYDEDELVLTSEAFEIAELIKSEFTDEKFSDYAVDFVISTRPELIFNENSYIMSSFQVDDKTKKITLFLHKAFLEAMKDLSYKERAALFEALVYHETQEYFESINLGAKFNINSFHDFLRESYASQRNLMDFAAQTAKSVMEQRYQRRDIAGEIAAELVKSQSIDDNPADMILILGNDEPATFEKALDLYAKGLAKKIAVSGGIGRLTDPLKEKALSLGINADMSGMREADIIKLILLHFAAQQGIELKDEDILTDHTASNTNENFNNDAVKNYIDSIIKSGRKARIAYIQKPIQQFRAYAAFNAVFENQIRKNEVEGISVGLDDFYKETGADSIAQDAASELIRLIVYSLKGDVLPAINDLGMLFEGAFSSGIWLKTAVLVEGSQKAAAIKKELLQIIKNTAKDGKQMFPDKKTLLDALSEKISRNSFQFAEMELFINSIYEEESAVLPLKTVKDAAASLIKLPSAIINKIIESWDIPSYLKDASRLFVFDTAWPQGQLCAYMGSWGSKSFSLTYASDIDAENILFDGVVIEAEDGNVEVGLGLVKSKTQYGDFYNIVFSVPQNFDITLVKLNLINLILSNSSIKDRLYEHGLDLRGISKPVYVNDRGIELGGTFNGISIVSLEAKDAALFNAKKGWLADLTDRRAASVEEKSRIIASAAIAAGEISAVEAASEKEALYNEKLTVSSMLKNDGDSGIGEITAVKNYADSVLKKSGVGGFTMQDIAAEGYPLIADWMLLDLSALQEAQQIISQSDIEGGIDEKETVNRELVAQRKLKAAVKLYLAVKDKNVLSSIEKYYAENKELIDNFSKSEFEKYNNLFENIGESEFTAVIAMQQMFFERQLKEVLNSIEGMNISMSLKNTDKSNVGAAIRKWAMLGITSFTLENDNIDEEFLKVLKEETSALAREGYFVSVSIKLASDNIGQNALDAIMRYGFTPVIPFSQMDKIKIKDGYRAEIDDASLISNSDIKQMLSEAALAGALFVDYPIGLLWGEKTS